MGLRSLLMTVTIITSQFGALSGCFADEELEHLKVLLAERNLDIATLKGEVARSNAVAAEQLKQLQTSNALLAANGKELAELRQKLERTETSLRETMKTQDDKIRHLEAKVADMGVQHAKSELIMELIRKHVPTNNGLPDVAVLLNKLAHKTPAAAAANPTAQSDPMACASNQMAHLVVRMPDDPCVPVAVERVSIDAPLNGVVQQYQLIQIPMGTEYQRRIVIQVNGINHYVSVRSDFVVVFDAEKPKHVATLK